MSQSNQLNNSVKSLLSAAKTSGMVPSGSGSVSGVAVSNSQERQQQGSPQFHQTNNQQTPSAPVKSAAPLGSVNQSVLSGNGSVMRNLFPSSPSSSPQLQTNGQQTPGAPVKAASSLSSLNNRNASVLSGNGSVMRTLFPSSPSSSPQTYQQTNFSSLPGAPTKPASM